MNTTAQINWNEHLPDRETNPPEGKQIGVTTEKCEHCKGNVYWYEQSDCKAEKHQTLKNGFVLKSRIYICKKCQKKNKK